MVRFNTHSGRKTLITGGGGMVAHAFRGILPGATFIDRTACDLRDWETTHRVFTTARPEVVVHLAGKVGGVHANTRCVADFYHENITINTNVLEAARLCGVRKLVAFLSTCIYPDQPCYPLTEDQIHNGPPHPSNFGYAYAKRMLDVQCRAYRQQYGCNFISVVPNNLYGPNDNFDLENGHVLPALIRKIWEAKARSEPLVVWGDGLVYREFTYSEDVARVTAFLLDVYDGAEPINVGCTREYLLRDVVEMLCDTLGFRGDVVWDGSRPKGQLRKPSSPAKLAGLGWHEYTGIQAGLQKTCAWFLAHYPEVRGVA
jgi:GDP-L-fucose synthase